MRAAIIGQPQSGKSTIFRVLTGSERPAGQRDRTEVGVAEIPDWRVQYLSNLCKPEKTTFARMDVVVLDEGDEQSFLKGVRSSDVLIEVIPAFLVAGFGGEGAASNVTSHFDHVNLAFLVKDLQTVENRLERLRLNKARPLNQMEPGFLQQCKEALESEIPLRNVKFDPVYDTFLKNFDFLTLKPFIFAVNVAEDSLTSLAFPGKQQIEEIARKAGIPVEIFSGPVEEEISRLPAEDRQEFLEEYGLDEPGAWRLARITRAHLNLISFFTIGADEVKAWTIPQGTTAVKAAGKIHSDMEKGFIRAEVMAFDDLYRLGSVKAVKEHGLYRSEGRDYVVKDGDILLIRFNV
ncbi:MAG TPA: redox-regulated ATPase YchF [Firmicutes bacterium]|nr:redox-regulated ATPase YchF [Candidatus Fermentithermobacillaceae bacterium]